jgi:hypothetical protein
METPTICYIDRLPNEILRLILSFVDDSGFYYRPVPHLPRFRNIVVVRWVSRRFRMTTNELGFWHKDDFDMLHVFNINKRRPRLQVRYIKTVLNDEDLIRCLNRKSGWEFHRIEEFLAIMASIPELPQNTRRIIFNGFREALNLAVDSLATFTTITELTIHFIDDFTFDLDAIVESCPLLETLDLDGLTKHCGSLAPAAKLRRFILVFDSEELGVKRFSPSLLPFNSTQSLTRLDITIYQNDTGDITHDLFAPFLNLTHVTTGWIRPVLCVVLIHGKFTLTHLDITHWTDYDDFPFETLLSIFDASSLKSLRELVFNLEPMPNHDDLSLERADQLCCAITNLRHLETLAFGLPCCTSWFKRFSKLSHLRSISLHESLIEFDDYDGELPSTGGC